MTVSSQLILSKTSQWTDHDKYPISNDENPLFIFNRENNNILYLKEVGSRKFCVVKHK